MWLLSQWTIGINISEYFEKFYINILKFFAKKEVNHSLNTNFFITQYCPTQTLKQHPAYKYKKTVKRFLSISIHKHHK